MEIVVAFDSYSISYRFLMYLFIHLFILTNEFPIFKCLILVSIIHEMFILIF